MAVRCVRLPPEDNIQLAVLQESVLEGFALHTPAQATSEHTAEVVVDKVRQVQVLSEGLVASQTC